MNRENQFLTKIAEAMSEAADIRDRVIGESNAEYLANHLRRYMADKLGIDIERIEVDHNEEKRTVGPIRIYARTPIDQIKFSIVLAKGDGDSDG